MRRRLLVTALVATVVVALATPARAVESGDDGDAALDDLRAVVVEESTDTVEVWVALPPLVDPDSVEVQLAGHIVVVRARDEAGRTLRSTPLRLRDPVIEEGAAARYEGAWIAVTLRKRATPGHDP